MSYENKQILHLDFIISDDDDPIHRPHFSHWFSPQTRSSQPQAKLIGNWCTRSPCPGKLYGKDFIFMNAYLQPFQATMQT